MTLDEKLKDLTFANVSADGKRRPVCMECELLLAALRKCREQRNEWITSTSHKEWSGKFIRRDDAELLKILEDGE